jgi:predicted DNA-binding antitoxin AbrB/MazE fold protein
MPKTTIEAVYEHGVLRLSRPIDLVEGTLVDVLVFPREEPAGSPTTRKKSPAELLSEIAALATPTEHPTRDARDHDIVLYGESSQ